MEEVKYIGYGIGIIRINNRKLQHIEEDQANLISLGFDIEFKIPIIEVPQSDGSTRPHNLLLNYGFIIAPLTTLRDRVVLDSLRKASIVINSMYFRKGIVYNIESVENPVVVETISLEKLHTVLSSCSKVANSYNDDEIATGQYLTLTDKPYDGLLVQVLSVSAKKIRVKFMINSDFTFEFHKSAMNFQKVYNLQDRSFAKELIE